MTGDVAIGRITECVEAINAYPNSDPALQEILDKLGPALRAIAAHLQEIEARQETLESAIEDMEYE